MINAAYSVLALRPKTFDSIGMSISENVNLFSMRNRSMFVSHDWQSVVNSEFIRENLRAMFNVFPNNWENGSSFDIVHFASRNLAAALNHSEYWSLAISTASPCPSRRNTTRQVQRFPKTYYWVGQASNEPACTFSKRICK